MKRTLTGLKWANEALWQPGCIYIYANINIWDCFAQGKEVFGESQDLRKTFLRKGLKLLDLHLLQPLLQPWCRTDGMVLDDHILSIKRKENFLNALAFSLPFT